MLEKENETYFVWAVEVVGGCAYKFKSPAHRGVADRIACLPDGSTWFVELKRPNGGRLSKLQILFGQKMIELNQKYIVLWSKEQIDEWRLQIASSVSKRSGSVLKNSEQSNGVSTSRRR
jgi:hypothetical protein